jgi:hypothetical protein
MLDPHRPARPRTPGGLPTAMVPVGAVAGSVMVVSVAFTMVSVLGSCPSWDRVPGGRPMAA